MTGVSLIIAAAEWFIGVSCTVKGQCAVCGILPTLHQVAHLHVPPTFLLHQLHVPAPLELYVAITEQPVGADLREKGQQDERRTVCIVTPQARARAG